MMRGFLAVVALGVALMPAARAAGQVYKLVATVPLGGADDWDYLKFDPASNRVLVGHGDAITLVDAARLAVVGRLTGIRGAHAAVVADGHIVADEGDSGTAKLFDAHTLAPIKTVPAGTDADDVVLEPATNRVFVVDGDEETATVLDPASGATLATIALGGKPEAGAADGAGRVFVNIKDTGEIARIDAASAKITARFKLPDCDSPHGLAADPAAELLFSTCLNGKMIALDAETGAVRATLPIGHGSDSAGFDPHHRRAFSSNGDGTLSVAQVAADGSVTALPPVMTAPGARTMTVDPATGRVFLVTAEVSGPKPPGHGGLVPHFAYEPGTVRLLVFDPQE